MGVNSLLKTVTRQRHDCDLNPSPSVPESSTLTTRLPGHPVKSTDDQSLHQLLHDLAVDVLYTKVEAQCDKLHGQARRSNVDRRKYRQRRSRLSHYPSAVVELSRQHI